MNQFAQVLLPLAQATSLSVATRPPSVSPAVLARIERAYSPALAMDLKFSGVSLYGCLLKDLKITAKDPVVGETGITSARVYRPPFSSDGDRPRTILLLPPTGGENGLDRGYANTLCLAGFQIVLLQRWPHDADFDLELTIHDKAALRALTAVRRVVDFVDPSRPVGILGTSVGALTSSLALGYDARISSGVFIVGGLGMAEIIAASDEAGARRLREARMQHFGFRTTADYLQALKAQIEIEPKDFAGFSGPKKALAFVGTEDVTVPTENQRDLVSTFRAESVEFAGDHTATILHTFALRQSRIVEFFKNDL